MARACRAVLMNRLLISETKQMRCQFHRRLVAEAGKRAAEEEEEEEEERGYKSCKWVPHPRIGIYFPEGHEWVMRDVPETAASFNEIFWLRNSDPDQDHPPSASPLAAVFDRNSREI